MCRNECMVPVYRSAGFINFNKCSFVVLDFNYFGLTSYFVVDLQSAHTCITFHPSRQRCWEASLPPLCHLVAEDINYHCPCFGYIAWNLLLTATLFFFGASPSPFTLSKSGFDEFSKILPSLSSSSGRVDSDSASVLGLYFIRFILFAAPDVGQLDVGYCRYLTTAPAVLLSSVLNFYFLLRIFVPALWKN